MKTRAERTTHSKHFDWIEDPNGGAWYGHRNAMTVMKIEYLGYGRYDADKSTHELSSRLIGHTSLSRAFVGLEAAQEAADKLWEDWAHAFGLKVDRQWWKERDRG